MDQLALFDYQQLDAETRIVVQQRTSEIKALMKRTAQDIIEIGEKLIEVKGKLPHGRFGAWLEAEFSWGWTTATKFMNVARSFSNFQNSENLVMSFETLALLAAPSTPDEARQEAIDRAQQGEQITHAAARQIVSTYKPNGNGTPPETLEDDRPLLAPDLDSALDELYRRTSERQNAPDGIMTKVKQEWQELTPPSFNYKRDNKANREGNIYTPQGYDACQTPAYALDPLFLYLQEDWIIWEPAAGEGYLAEGLYDGGYRTNQVITTDLLTGINFFEYEPESWDCLVTNPPYSIKYQWLERCYQLGKPFALLMPVETLGAKTAQLLFKQYGGGVIFLDKRINFKMPNKGWDSSAQFPVAWFTWGLDLGQSYQVAFGEIKKAHELVS